MEELAGRVALVTGGSRGIGAATAQQPLHHRHGDHRRRRIRRLTRL
jgi:NAD(P)-dependent dehydrogenase (short-subunit alcohol dehydrogenase family)